VQLADTGVAAPASTGSGLTPDGFRMLEAIEALARGCVTDRFDLS
jgi:hypothetical protein